MSIIVKDQNKVVNSKQAKRLLESGKARLDGPSAIRMVEESSSDTRDSGAGFVSRGFKDNHPFPFGPFIQPSTDKMDHKLTPALLREIHRKSSAVRPCVSFLVRTLSTTPWSIVSQGSVPKKNMQFAVDLFTQPGASSRTFRELLAKILTDLFVLDSLYVEKVRAAGGGLVEMEARDPATFKIVPGDSGEIVGYKQTIVNDKGIPLDTIDFDVEDIYHTVFYPRTDSFIGTPIAEAIIEEISALMLASKGIASFFDEDEIPAGILHLGDLGREGWERARSDFESKGGMKSKRQLRTTFGRTEPRWIPFQRPFREMEIAQLMPRLERIVFRNFGITPLDLGMSQDVNRSTAEAFKEIRTFTLFKPILDLLAEGFTFDILHEIDPGLFLEFQHFSRTGEESDADGTGKGFGTETVPVDTDVPGEDDVGESGRSPLFGGYGMREVYQRMPRWYRVICRPPVLPAPRARSFNPDAWSDKDIVRLLVNDEVRESIERSVDAGNAVVQTLLTEMAEEVHDMVHSKATDSEIRTMAEYGRDEIINQLEASLRSTEAASHEYVCRIAGDIDYKETTSGLTEEYKRALDELVVSQMTNTTIGADEEASMISAFDADKLTVDDMVVKAAVSPIRKALKSKIK